MVSFGSLLDLFMSSVVCLNVLSTFEFDAFLFMSLSTEIFGRWTLRFETIV